MLVLSRRPGQTIRIGDNISVKVVAVRGDRVRLGIVAPDGTRVDRDEISRKIAEQGFDPRENSPSCKTLDI